ncbi:MAG: ABC transporter permease [Owenweeksia sp.]|nr:ABC transporter permease [Owenweeksia sp.]
MIKLLKLEWLKLSRHRFFWIGMGLYTLCLVLVITQVGNFTINNQSEGGMVQFDDLATAGIYKLPHLWQHMTYMAAFLKIIPSFLLIFFVANEFQYRTIRQNVIDGLSVGQFYGSKILSALLFTFYSLLVVIIAALIMGMTHNPGASMSQYFKGTDFLAAYSVEVFCMMALGLFLTFLFKRSTISIIIILLYYYVLENILIAQYGSPLVYFLPTGPSRELNLQFFTRLMGGDALLGTVSQVTVPLNYLGLSLLYSFGFLGAGYFILKRRDL